MNLDVFGLNSEMSADENRLIKKRDLRNLLTSYADEADVFAEIIQNAVDAINIARDTGLYANDDPKLTVFLGRRDNESHYFAVSDNGIGMSPDVAGKFTSPGFSALKRMGKTVGYKGVGASFFFAAANRIAFRTVDPNGTVTAANILGSLRWVLNDTAPLPIVGADFDAPQLVLDRTNDARGTTIVYHFDPAWKPSSLTYMVKREDDGDLEVEHWAFFLSSRTALGSTMQNTNGEILVEFILDRGVECAPEDGQIRISGLT